MQLLVQDHPEGPVAAVQILQLQVGAQEESKKRLVQQRRKVGPGQGQDLFAA